MTKIYVIHENNEWTTHLEKRLIELKLDYELWHLDEGLLDLTQTPPQGVFYNRISASSHTRGHRFAPEFADSVLNWLEKHERTVVNGTRAVDLELSKVKQYMALNASNITTPKTIAAVGKKNIVKAAASLGQLPFITKHNRAGKGQGVYLFNTIDELQNYLESNNFDEPVDGITLIQQYIKAPQPFIVRHEFIDGKFFYAVKVDTSQGFELCPADACSLEDLACPASSNESTKTDQSTMKFEILSDYQGEIIAQYEAFLATNKIKVAGIESICDKNGVMYTYDVNTNTNYNSDAENKANKFAMLALAKYLGELAQA